MKKTIILLFAVMSMAVKAQNVQALYDFGRGCMTTTIEMFKPDIFSADCF